MRCVDAVIVRPDAAGVTDVVLAVNYRPEVMVAMLSQVEEQYNIKITFSVETEPLGTGPSLGQATALTRQPDRWRSRGKSSARTTRPSSCSTRT